MQRKTMFYPDGGFPQARKDLEAAAVAWLMSLFAVCIANVMSVSTVLVVSGDRWRHIADAEEHADTGVLVDLSDSRWFTWCGRDEVEVVVRAWAAAGVLVIGPALVSPHFYESQASAAVVN
jgi:hypothetical protein